MIIKIEDIVFIKDSGSIRNDLEMCQMREMKAL